MVRRSVSSLVVMLAVLTLTAASATAAAAAKSKPTGRMGLTLAGAFRVGSHQLAVAGRRLRVDGRIVPYVPHQQVVLRIWNGHKLIKQVTAHPRPTATTRTATFAVRFTPMHSGTIQVFAIHARTDAQRRVEAHAAPFEVVAPSTHGPFVALLQQQLAALGYAVSRSGVYDSFTQEAVLAFRKVNGMARSGSLSPTIVDRVLRGVGGFHVRFPKQGRHVEANLGWQVLALIDKGHVVRAYVTSSGKPSTPTVLGSFHFYSKTPGTNGEGMVDANYFIRGYAIHGYFEVPTYNASHGCLRVPIHDAAAIYAWVHLGDRIDVYY